MPGIVHIAIVMKPTKGSFLDNAKAQQVAGFNIKATRVQGDNTTWILRKSKTAMFAQELRPCKDRLTGTEIVSGGEGGRWPANILLCHAPACTARTCAPDCPLSFLPPEETRYFHQTQDIV